MPRILVIDDDRFFRIAVTKDLERAGFETLAADEGDTGLTMARQHRPDVILCDVRMRRMDGYAVLSALRGEPATATIPFILMTGLTPDEGMREGMNLGADDYLTKPYNAEDLFASVQAQLRKLQAIHRREQEHLDQLRASISLALPHELRTPLGGILGGAELLMMEGGTMPAAEIKELAEDVYLFGKRLEHLVEDFLIYAQIELLARDPAEVAVLRKACTRRPEAVLSRVASTYAGRNGRQADLSLDVVRYPVAISEPYLEKMLDELLDNAFKFSLPGSPVRAEMRRVGTDLHISVHDQGCGMDARQVHAIGAYMQFERKMNEQQGTGLGLHIVKRLAHLHDGHFHIASSIGAGTTVELHFPGAVGAMNGDGIGGMKAQQAGAQLA